MISDHNITERIELVMAKERSFLNRNVGTKESPTWEKWYAITVADAVMMSDSDTETKTIEDFVVEKFNAIVGGATTYTTLKQVEDWIAQHKNEYATLVEDVGNKVDKEPGKGLSSNDYTNEEKQKVQNAINAALYTNSSPTVQAHGGVPVGQTFNNMPVNEVLDMILYPWIAPVVSCTVTAPSNGGNFEKGSTQNVTNIRVNVTKKSHAITKVEIFDGSSSLGAKTDGVSNGGQFDFTVKQAVTTNKSFSVKVTDAKSKTTTANSGTFNFVYPFYWGAVAATGAVTEDVVEALSKQITTKGNKNVNFTCTNERICFAYPKAYGDLRTIKDQNNFDVTGTFTKTVVSITGLDNTPQDYNVYVNSPSTVSGFGMTFNF